ncbi:hypothetical protein M0804_009622 [Polistes exclamans]|nr:hypothetical protein M0804_009622 [Polistes exclamans]
MGTPNPYSFVAFVREGLSPNLWTSKRSTSASRQSRLSSHLNATDVSRGAITSDGRLLTRTGLYGAAAAAAAVALPPPPPLLQPPVTVAAAVAVVVASVAVEYDFLEYYDSFKKYDRLLRLAVRPLWRLRLLLQLPLRAHCYP